jgi:hypothetical protein
MEFAVITVDGTLTVREAERVFMSLSKIAPGLFSSAFVGFAQIDLNGSRSNNSMLFLQPSVTKEQFVSGLAIAPDTVHDANYATLDHQGQPMTDSGLGNADLPHHVSELPSTGA